MNDETAGFSLAPGPLWDMIAHMSKPMVESDVHRRLYHFTGRVQGVGFRYTTRNIAIRHNVAGYVRNLPDGRVELVMEGPATEIQHVVEAVHRPGARVARSSLMILGCERGVED